MMLPNDPVLQIRRGNRNVLETIQISKKKRKKTYFVTVH